MIQVKNLSKSFDAEHGPRWAVKDVSFTIDPGDVLGFLGPNGAGKSTTMKMMTGFLSPGQGTVKYGNLDIIRDTRECQRFIGYVPENAPLYHEMTVSDFLRFCAEVRGLKADHVPRRLDEVLRSCRLWDVEHERIENLSKGYRRRVSIAQALVHDPQFLILDEPTDGLDPNQKHHVRTLLKELAANNKAVVISTHILEEVEAICNKVVLIADGKVRFAGTPSEFRGQAPSGRLDEVFRTLTSNIREVVHA